MTGIRDDSQSERLSGARRGVNRGSRPRVLMFHPALAPYRIDLFNALALRLELRVLFLDRDVPYQAYDQGELRRRLDVDHRILIRRYSFAGRAIAAGVGAELRAYSPDVVVTNEFSPTTFEVAVRRQRRVAQVIWTADNVSDAELIRGPRLWARRAAVRLVDGMMVYSSDVARMYRTKFRFRGSMGIVPNVQAPDALQSRYSGALSYSAEYVRRFELDRSPVVLFVGRLARVKRVDRLIDAFAAGAHNHKARLVIVGDGAERSALESQACARGVGDRTIFVGHLEGTSLHAWYNVASLLVLPSEFEPWGAVVDEALGAGVPVLCSSIAGARALIRRPEQGAVVDCSQPAVLADVLDRFLRHSAFVATDGGAQVRRSLMGDDFQSAVDSFVHTVDAVRNARATKGRN